MSTSSARPTLRDLSPVARVVIAIFLIAVGIGYFSALVQLHFQHAAAGELLPGLAQITDLYSGKQRVSTIERLLTAAETMPFNGKGQMRTAFTDDSAGWQQVVRSGAEQEERPKRDADRLALIDWVRHGADREAYDYDSYAPSTDVNVSDRYLLKGPGPSHLERVLTPPPGMNLLDPPRDQPFSGEGGMWQAFFGKSTRWKNTLQNAKNTKKDADLVKEREGERLALLDWVHTGAKEDEYTNNDHPLSRDLAEFPITKDYLTVDADDKVVVPHHIQLKTLLKNRCERCHSPNVAGIANQAPLDTYELVKAYCEPAPGIGQVIKPERVKIRSIIQEKCVRCHSQERGGDERARNIPLDSYERVAAYCQPDHAGGMPIRALAQTTHAHLLSFAMLFSLTGLVFCFTSFPVWIRVFFGPLTLLAQLGEISCWWLSRVDPVFAYGIAILGGVVAVTLCVHILGSLFDMKFGRTNRRVV
jgi:hypothetical protein